MSRLKVLLVPVVAAAGLVAAGVAARAESGRHRGSEADVAALIETDKRMQRAFVDRDVAALEAIFTDDYVLVVASGAERTKREVIDAVKSPDTRWDVNDTSGWVVRVHGDTAIVVATLHQKGVDRGTAFDSNVKFSDTYIRVDGQWRNVHAHASKAVDVVATAAGM